MVNCYLKTSYDLRLITVYRGSMTNKAIYVKTGGGFDVVTVGVSDAAKPKSHEITVRVKASSLNYHDYIVVSGMWGPTESRIPMSDGAGEVIAVGDAVTEFKVGDHVVSLFFGGWSEGRPRFADFSTVPGDGVDGFARETVTLPATAFTRAPKGYSDAESSTLTTAGLTAWRALMVDAAIKPGDTVLVQGTGGVSIFALQFAKMAGATVIATSSSEAKLAKLKQLGADHTINYKEHPKWGEVVLQLTNGEGVDCVIEVGGPATIDQSMIATRIGGHISLIGVLTGFDGPVSLITAIAKNLKIQGVLVGSREQQVEMIKAIEATGMKPVIDKHFPLEKIVDAFKYQEGNQHFGKICLDI